MSLGKAVLRMRQAKNLTQGTIGERAGLATSYLSRIENGRLQPTMPTLQKIAEALGVTVAQIFQVSEGAAKPPGQRCPVSTSGQCIGEQLRSGRGRRPEGDHAEYGPEELRILRLTNAIVTHGSPEVRAALEVMLEALSARLRPSGGS